MDILEGLNDEQRRAVVHDAGPLLILAGAGSGKTKTLTHRIAYLISEKSVLPTRILAVTFTNKAAREMRERIASILGESADDRNFMPWMGTFHSICVKLLRIDGHTIGLSPRFVIYDEDDKRSLIKQTMKGLGLSDRDIKISAITGMISKAKNQLQSSQDFAMTASGPIAEKVAEIYEHYERQLRSAAALDFDDLLVKTVEMLQGQSDVRRRWSEQFRYILIDEYQDTNAVQYALIRLLINPERNISVVGDDAQSIYSFRGADYTNILNFSRDFPGTEVVKLEQNYRSTEAILNLANNLISHNVNRTDKNLWTAEAGGVEPALWQVYSEAEEGMRVASEVMAQMIAGRSYDDVAVLYRTNAQSYAIERSLREFHIPYKIVGGLRFLDRAVVKDILAYVRIIYQPSDIVSFSRVVNVPKRGIGAVSVQKFISWHQMSGRSIVDSLQHIGECDVLTPKAKKSLELFGQTLGRLASYLEGSPADLIEQIIDQTGYTSYINDGSPQADDNLENIGVLVAEARSYTDVQSFLEEMALMSSTDEAAREQVTLMTLHAAKGLEFPVVFLVGLEEGLLPHARVFDSGVLDDIEEERRLCYVGVTRAREQLFISCASSRTQFGQIGYNMPSRFLGEMGIYTPAEDRPASNANQHYSDDGEFFADELGLSEGDRVRAPKFGPGKIIEVDGLAVVVGFDNGQTKKLNVEFARLEKL